MQFSKCSILIAVIALCLASVAIAGPAYIPGFEYKVLAGEQYPSGYLYIDNTPAHGLGTFGLASAASKYGQFYAGPMYMLAGKSYGTAPRWFVESGLGAGLERDVRTNRVRNAIVIFSKFPLAKSSGYFNWVNERSYGSNAPDSWSRFEVFGDLTPAMTLGLTAQSKLGAGPRIGYEFKAAHLKAWSTTLYDGDRVAVITSLVGSF